MRTNMRPALFDADGHPARNADLHRAVRRFRALGGDYETALAVLKSAYEAGGKDVASGAIRLDAHRASTERSAGHLAGADKADTIRPVAASPGHAKRGAAAIGSIQGAVAKSLFDTVVLPDGRKLREVRWAECPALATKYRRLSHILIAVHNHAIPSDPNTSLDAIVAEKELARIVADAEKINAI